MRKLKRVNFLGAPLAKYLLANKTTLVGTVRLSSRSVASVMKEPSEINSARFYKSDNVLTTSFQPKPQKKVILFSTMHSNALLTTQNGKTKPEIIHFYNKTKVGVDCLDAMLRLYSCKAATRRWPLSCFWDLLDKAALNSWILFRKSTGNEIKRKPFIIALGESLCKEQREKKAKKSMNSNSEARFTSRVLCKEAQCHNKSYHMCSECNEPVCGKHSEKKTVCLNCKE